MRLIGMAERAFELMCKRADERIAFGKPLAEQSAVAAQIADARVRIDQLRLLVLRAAWLIDQGGAKNARTEISAIKIAAPTTAQWVIDQAIQVHGAGGLTADYPLAMLWAQARGLRFADGPEEVHRMVLARELAAARPATAEIDGSAALPRQAHGDRSGPSIGHGHESAHRLRRCRPDVATVRQGHRRDATRIRR